VPYHFSPILHSFALTFIHLFTQSQALHPIPVSVLKEVAQKPSDVNLMGADTTPSEIIGVDVDDIPAEDSLRRIYNTLERDNALDFILHPVTGELKINAPPVAPKHSQMHSQTHAQTQAQAPKQQARPLTSPPISFTPLGEIPAPPSDPTAAAEHFAAEQFQKARQLFTIGMIVDPQHGPLYHAYGNMEMVSASPLFEIFVTDILPLINFYGYKVASVVRLSTSPC
jgi:hypothetical protein